MGTKSKKRAAPAPTHSSKKQKLQQPSRPSKSAQTKNKSQEKGKEKAFERDVIAIPNAADADTGDSDVSDADAALVQEFGGAIDFLRSLDHKAIARSKKETERLHQLHKPVRKSRDDDLPPIVSDDDDAGDSSSSVVDDIDSDEEESEGERQSFQGFTSDSDVEMPYERVPRKRDASVESDRPRQIQGLPIKLADGRIQATGKMTVAPILSESEDDEDNDEVSANVPTDEAGKRVEDVATGARFGRPAVVDVVGNKSRAARIHGAKEQIASICQEIIADPENSLGLLRRLHTFSIEKITSPAHPEPVANDAMIRKLAMLSQLAVFKDIIPGYRIRALTEKEKAEKVSQMVAHTREWEQGLLVVYQTYLRTLDNALKAKDELTDIALKCMCTLATEVTHFNFRANLMSCIVARLSKKSWDESSDLCLNTLISIFRNDLTGVPSLEIVQLLNRMIKERHFKVHPEVLSCLLHLRLKSELNVRASDTKVDTERPKKHSQGRAASRRAKGKPTDQPHLSKKAKKAFKERKEIEKEVREAEAEVDKEERARTHTETLKLLFMLYFRILKNPHPTPLLPAALRGISKFAHLVNVDFFKDLMQVLRGLIVRESTGEGDSESPDWDTADNAADILNRLLCIVTAFELLSGQGEALNIDLSDFVKHLYAIILPVSLLPQIDAPPPTKFASNFRISKPESIADMLFRALNIVFSPRSSGGTVIPWRSAAFAKRLLIASINWPPNVTLRALEFIEALVAKDPKLEALLSTEDRSTDGVYLPQVDDPQLSRPFGTSFFELLLLQQCHYDSGVREAAQRLSRCTNR
ncbi:nucleolar complex-associated protein-domain-containing protein [Pisolithus orientalis]|uniref:nucleolar complex-associated protein-domain-containing protein n=1 Tax=Pisolithus orientalis TaxID=936130 RepID=UPI0022259929|nr:nucleolar complex-associated protein-domain-containing protein [Pisolithus orientalis]KAI5986030.1 nucleolar complex-associated protein-domain-containing protein [Pisolithus orientalis]